MLTAFKYYFPQSVDVARQFLEWVNNETKGCASHPFCAKSASIDTKSVLVKGTGNKHFDMELKAKCDDFCSELGGLLIDMNS